MTLKTAAVGYQREKLELIQSWRKGGNILSKMLNLCCETPVSLVLCVMKNGERYEGCETMDCVEKHGHDVPHKTLKGSEQTPLS